MSVLMMYCLSSMLLYNNTQLEVFNCCVEAMKYVTVYGC